MKRVTGIGGLFFKCQDPEGNKIELWEPVDDKLQP
jgi:predicted enzyme related to lactoylglutathione lyase